MQTQLHRVSDERNVGEQAAVSKLSHALHVQEKNFKEKSSNQWLELGDKCTRFFHLEATINASRKNISSMVINGSTVEDQD